MDKDTNSETILKKEPQSGSSKIDRRAVRIQKSYEDAKKEAEKKAKESDEETKKNVQGMTEEQQDKALKEKIDKAGDKLAAIMKGKPQDK
tara:strand:+ start:1661 stop:1930 length:270 start_codon:yes stop_codon:yes gene_type:complete